MKQKLAGWAELLCITACLCSFAACNEKDSLSCSLITVGNYDANNTGHPYFIDEAGIMANCLLMKVSYSGGCLPKDSMVLRWNGAPAESYPPQVYLSLWHSNLGDLCKAIEDTTLLFNLAAINTDTTIKTTIVHLSGYEEPLYYHKQ
ncbi:hypothetical protein C7N43_29260 [Sphingobacteriales bacterium UPWRP_1]|nr:hypothetical protein B6N25_17060 [Sphingobacteriales bacterium TSM_CSS]PSJ73418.1 hypothetical protein C7N43_29260 [Sphingobacteriales bacterium UPWRP_1]